MKKIILPSLLMTQLLTANVFADTTLKTSDVFVTATRTSIPKKNVIADITLISEEEIKLAGSSSLPELLQRQPGIEISNNGGQGTIMIEIVDTKTNEPIWEAGAVNALSDVRDPDEADAQITRAIKGALAKLPR